MSLALFVGECFAVGIRYINDSTLMVGIVNA
jgi:hypothetical protein